MTYYLMGHCVGCQLVRCISGHKCKNVRFITVMLVLIGSFIREKISRSHGLLWLRRT